MSHVTRRRFDRALARLRRVVDLYRSANIPFMAGSVAYAAFLSLIPLAVMLVYVASLFGGEEFVTSALRYTSRYLAPSSRATLTETLVAVPQRTGVPIAGSVGLLWTTTKVFRALDTAFSTLYGTEGSESIVGKLADAVTVLAAIVTAILVLLAAGVLSRFAPDLPSIEFFNALALTAVLTVAFLPMFYVFPDADVTVREALPGTVVAALGWTVLQSIFQVYVAVSATGKLYGVLGGGVLFVLWLYFGAIVLLLGAATNVALFHYPAVEETPG